ncbi:hypothetical protein [uncultured Nitrospira sp.]|uniref:hypothetical protein n=1 Tax=uncultured Nitrospira sp. TaxID=157176 RepID=UPI00314024D7
MNNPNVADQVCEMLFRPVEIMVVVLFSMAGPLLGDGAVAAACRSENQAAFSHENRKQEKQDSPLIGNGVRTPPDIGALGTASSTPPVRTESPTDEPQILPDISPVPTHPSDQDKAPVKENEPLGQPTPLR